MGLIDAAAGAVGGTLADQWKEYFYCDSIPADTLMIRGRKQASSQGRSSNTSGEDNVITNGSGIAVNAGQCMIIVEDGQVVDICDKPGRYTYQTDLAPSVFTSSDLAANIKQVFSDIGKRFTYGGDPGRNQRVYYVNTKEVIGNKYGTPAPVPFKIYVEELQSSFPVNIRCFGEYSYKIRNPILFYTNLGGNVTDAYRRDEIDSQLKSELMNALQPALAKVSAMKIGYDELPAHTYELSEALNEVLSKKWSELRGIEIVSFGVSSVKADEEDEARIKEKVDKLVDTRVRAIEARNYTDPTMAAARVAAAQSTAMENAAQNEGGMGAMGAFMGMGMAGAMGGMQAGNLFAQGQQAQQQMPPQPPQPPPTPQGGAGGAMAGAAAGWACACGKADNTGKFCAECGKPQPAPAAGWTCACGAVNQGKFCPQCGTPKPADAPLYRCDKCGWNPPDPKNPPKVCPECGDAFDAQDVSK